MSMRNANPALKKGFNHYSEALYEEKMSLQGAVNKTLMLLAILFVSAFYVWSMDYKSILLPLSIGAIGGVIFALITVFKPSAAPITAPIYAVLEGLALGGISVFFELQFPGIVFQAVLITISILLALLMIYKMRIIEVTQNFRLGVTAATFGIAIVYLVNIILGFFGFSVPFIHESGLVGIGISLVIVTIAALNLVLDFDFIEQGANQGFPKYMEWYSAFGLLVTLIWLYLEILKLLSKLRSRD